ncbi:MAG: exodeoxyribonuclease VII small subunit [Coriobacteriales bacterium]|jgi:exodeoxyribonuclease VII small subunit
MDRHPDNQSSYSRVKDHLDEIVEQIRSKDVSLEQALDLYEEAVRLGNSCADLIDMTDFSMEELETFNATKDGLSGEDASSGDAESSEGIDDAADAGDSDGETDEAGSVDDPGEVGASGEDGGAIPGEDTGEDAASDAQSED